MTGSGSQFGSFVGDKMTVHSAFDQIFKSESIFTGVRRQSSLNLVVDFIHLLEALMMEYLSCGWDSVDKVGPEYNKYLLPRQRSNNC